jgi:hypothetical protein
MEWVKHGEWIWRVRWGDLKKKGCKATSEITTGAFEQKAAFEQTKKEGK